MKEKVVIIGGGAIGLASAYYLEKNNKSITLIDKGEFGDACSKGNMGWVCPLLTEPVPSPGLVGTSFKWMLKRDSPLYIKPLQIPKMSSWLIQFWRSCNATNYEKGQAALLELQKNTLTYFDELEEDGLVFEMDKEGFLFLFINEEALEKKQEQLQFRAEKLNLNSPKMLSADEVKEILPSVSSKVSGGIFLSDQYHIRPETLWKSLSDRLESSGVEMKPRTEVTGFERKDGKVVAVTTNHGRIEGDKFLIAAGVWSASLAKKLGYQIPIQAGKGYSVTMTNPSIQFPYPMYLGDSSTAITPFSGAARIGGTMELSGISDDLDARRINGIRSSVPQYLSRELTGDTEVEWAGMRPMTPDGLPVLGQLPGLENVTIASGHGMEGVVLALATGKIMTDIIGLGKTDVDITPFRVERFKAQ